MLNWIATKLGYTKRPRTSEQALNAIADAVSYVSNSGSAMTWQQFYGILNSEKMGTNTDAALRLTAVKCALEIYTGMVQSLPRRMYSVDSATGDKVRVIGTTDHPASRLFSHYFHPELTADDALLVIVYDVLMDGNAYFLREPDNMGRTSRLYYIHPSRIPRDNIYRANGSEDLTNGRKAVKGELLYRIDSGVSNRDAKSEFMLLPKSDIAHFKGKVLDQEYHRAHGFIANSANALEMYQAAEKFGRAFYTKGFANQIFLTTDNRLAPDVLKRLEANFEEDPNAPLDSIFRTRILEQGLKPINSGIPFQHLQFIETRAFSVEDVARGFNIPPALLHSYMGTDAGNTDLAQATALFVQAGIGPFLSRLCSQFRTELLPLPSQMLYTFEFETLYLYRNVIDKFSSALRNLFEIGMVNRKKGCSLLGIHIDPSDAAADPRYVPVNIMTVEHSLHLEEGASLANDMTEKQIEQQQQTNDGMVSGDELKAAQDQLAAAKAKPTSGKMDKSPSKKNIDKRIRNAFLNVLNGLKQYEARVLEQKKQSRPDDYDAAVTEFYAQNSKFDSLLTDQLSGWQDLITVNGKPLSDLRTAWLSSQKLPEGIEDGISCIEP